MTYPFTANQIIILRYRQVYPFCSFVDLYIVPEVSRGRLIVYILVFLVTIEISYI